MQDGSPDFRVYQVYARAVSPLLEKDATGTPEVPAAVVYEGREAMLSHDLVAETETETDTDRYRDGDRDALHTGARLSSVSLKNPGAGHGARALPGGPSVVTEGYVRSRPLPPTLVTKTGPPRHFRVTEAPVLYSVSCVCVCEV